MMTFLIQNTIHDFHWAISNPIRYDNTMSPIVLAYGGWRPWLITQCEDVVSNYWTRSFLIQDFVCLPWYASRSTSTTTPRWLAPPTQTPSPIALPATTCERRKRQRKIQPSPLRPRVRQTPTPRTNRHTKCDTNTANTPRQQTGLHTHNRVGSRSNHVYERHQA